MTDIPDNLEIKLTFAPPSFFLDVLGGRKDVPYWQVATVTRILRDCDIVFDPKGKMQSWVDQAPLIEWDPNLVELKRQTASMLLDRMNNRLKEEMFADAFMWLIKAAEEAICIPLMEANAFKIGTATLLLDILRDFDEDLYSFFANLLRIPAFTSDKVENARKELENLADHLYQANVKTDREMWILAAFVSINESERRLNQSRNAGAEYHDRLLETAIGELWQGYWLVAQNPRKTVKLDPWVVASFWNHFGSDELDDEWLLEQEDKIKQLL